MHQPSKPLIREQLLQVRDKMPRAERARYNTRIRERILSLPEIQQAVSIFSFISFDTEVDTQGLIKILQALGKTVVVPRTFPRRKMIPVLLNSWAELETDGFGILVPKSTRAFSAGIDICLTPGLGFTRAGYRLGYGAGYYDTWFSDNEVKHKIGIAYDCQVIDDLPVDQFDVPVDKIVTEKQTYTAGEMSKYE